MLFSFLSMTVRALPLEYPRIPMSKCHTAGTASVDLRALADVAETPLISLSVHSHCVAGV